MLDDETLYRDDLLFGVLQRSALRLQRLGEFRRALVERRANRVDFRMKCACRGQIFVQVSERDVFGFQYKRIFERPLLKTSNFGVAFTQFFPRLRQDPLCCFRA